MSEQKQITEESGVHKAWYERARKLKAIPELVEFMEELMSLRHDYGTICHALAASAVGACWVMNGAPHGGITGFQSGVVMWEFIRHWIGTGDKPQRLLDFENMLYPQYETSFRAISAETWAWLQTRAKENLVSKEGAAKSIIAHWRSIVDGQVPFGYRVDDA